MLLQLISKFLLVLGLAATSACTIKTVQAVATEPIGQVTMLKDRTIHLMLRAELPSGAIGDGFFVLLPGDKNYEATIVHVGGLEPGQSKPVPPWPAIR
jgi:hypothetical protein